MIRYRYADQLIPPAPFVNVTLRRPGTDSQIGGTAAQLDYGADRTVLPGRFVEALGLVEDGRAHFEGFAGEIIKLPIFLLEIQLHDLAPQVVRAVLGEHEPYVLLGRDILNAHRIVLDGPQLALEIDRP
jgi:hypothetical protein